MYHSRLLVVLVCLFFTAISCKNDSSSPVGSGTTDPWVTGQSAEGIFGRPDFTTDVSVLVGRNTIPNPYGLALTGDGTLFVADQGGYRVLRFNNATSKPNGD